MIKNISQELLDKQYLKLTYADGNTNAFATLLNTEEYHYMETENENAN